MQRFNSLISLILLVISCSNKKVEEQINSPIKEISIFEIYFAETKQLDNFNLFLQDTLKLPIEWKPFDFFGDGVVYDAAFYLGNTTLELLALYPGDSTMNQEARFNRILFQSKNINNSSSYLKKVDLPFNPAFDFNIVSEKSQLTIGKQINLDSLSNISNVNIAFWEYLPAGFNFSEREFKAESLSELKINLDSAFNLNPLGIIGLKEIRLNLDKNGIDQWHKLLGQSEENAWTLDDGLTISFTTAAKKGIDWIKIRVKDLSNSKEFLLARNLLTISDNQISIDRTKIYGLKIYLEE